MRTKQIEMSPAVPAAARGGSAILTGAGILAFSAATAIAAQPEVRLPFTPVPLTLQVLTVLLAGYFLGARAGFASQGLYLAAGAAGIPVFAGGASGPWHLLGPTAGYLWAMPLAAAVVGAIAGNRYAGAPLRFAAAFAGVGVIHLGGVAGLALFLAANGHSPLAAVSVGFLPFLLPDLLKATLAASLDAARRSF